jgi:hypothetical protein
MRRESVSTVYSTVACQNCFPVPPPIGEWHRRLFSAAIYHETLDMGFMASRTVVEISGCD